MIGRVVARGRFGTGASLTFINNLAQHIKSLASSPGNPVPSDIANVHVVTLSVARKRPAN